MKPNTQTREEFEENERLELQKVIAKAKEIRDEARLLERSIASKEEKMRNLQNTLAEIGQELVIIQAKLYAGGTT